MMEQPVKSNTSETEKAALFWSWFSSHETRIRRLIKLEDMHELKELITPQVKSLGNFGWEFGPGTTRQEMFCITFNGNIDNIPLARSVISEAPKLDNWEFHAGRPPKKWDGQFEISNTRGQSVSLDSSKWVYTLCGYDNYTTFDIKFIANSKLRLDQTSRRQAAQIALTGYLGEYIALTRFEQADLIDFIEPEDEPSFIANLADHIKYLDSIKSTWDASSDATHPT